MCSQVRVAVCAVASLILAAATDATAQPAERNAPAWGGFYVGLHGGIDLTAPGREIPFTSTLLPGFIPALGASGSTTVPTNRSTFAYGGQIGYNYQIGTRVIGFEIDLLSLAKSETTNMASTSLPHPVSGTIATNFTATQGTRWVGTARGRLGYTITPALLVYATGGLAFGEIYHRASFVQDLSGFPATTPGLAATNSSAFRVGLAIGAGAEWMLAPRLSTKLEYLHYDLGMLEGQSAFVYPNVATTVGATATRAYFSDHVFRIGLNYRLN